MQATPQTRHLSPATDAAVSTMNKVTTFKLQTILKDGAGSNRVAKKRGGPQSTHEWDNEEQSYRSNYH